MEISICLASRDDYHEMIRLADLTMPDRMNQHELRKYFELFPQLVFKAVQGDQLVGFCCAGVDMFQRTGWLLFNSVTPAYQGKGIGKRMIEARLHALRQIPTLLRVRVTVNRTNLPSIRALQSFGFVWSHTESDYYGPGKDREIMEMPLAPVAVKMPVEELAGAVEQA